MVVVVVFLHHSDGAERIPGAGLDQLLFPRVGEAVAILVHALLEHLDFPQPQRESIDAHVVDGSVEVILRVVAAAEISGRRARRLERAARRRLADDLSVAVDFFDGPVERGRDQMPPAVQELGRIDRRIEFGVGAVHV